MNAIHDDAALAMGDMCAFWRCVMSRQDKVDLNLFRVLDAIYTHEGISGAARALNLTQPAISHSLARLREILGDALFERQGNRFIPTEKTRVLMPRVQEAIAELHSTLLATEDFDCSALEMTWVVGFRDVLESVVFPTLMQELSAEAPKVQIVSRKVPRENMEKELSSGGVDVVVDRRFHPGPMIRSQYICDEKLVVVMAGTHPLARTGLSREDYLRARHIVVAQQGRKESIDIIFNEAGHVRDVGLVCQTYFSACQVAAGSRLLLTMPYRYARILMQSMPITIFDLPFRIQPMHLEMYWHESKDSASAHAWLRAKVDRIIKSGAPQPSKDKRRADG